MAQLRLHINEFQRQNALVLAITSEDREHTSKLAEELNLPFPLLSDTDRSTIRSYGVFHDNEAKGRSIARPATFVLDARHRIIYRYVGENQADRPEISEVLGVLSELENAA